MKPVFNTLVSVVMLLTLIEFVRSNIAYYSHNTIESAGRIANSGTAITVFIAVLYIVNACQKKEN